MFKLKYLLLLVLLLSTVGFYFMNSQILQAQNKKPRFSQLDFDEPKHRGTPTPTPENLTPLEMLLRQAQEQKNDNKDQDSRRKDPRRNTRR